MSGLRALGSSGPQEREVWRVMADGVIARIRSGELAEGARIPSVAELMLAFAEPDREHARRAVQVLCSQRWAVALGPGTFVVAPASRWPSRGEGRAARIHRGGPEPVYRQIADILEEEIADGEIKPGAMVPSQSELRREFGVSHMSARKARQELHDRGLVHTVGGATMFVGPEGPPLRGESERAAANSGVEPERANRIRRDGPVPMYRQIAEIIADQIARGELGAGEMVPSEKELKSEFGIAQMTARNVHRELRERELAHTVPGEGTFVGPVGTPRPESLLPVFQVIVNELVAEIRAGEILPKNPIPSENVLVVDKGVSKATIRRAIAVMREDGWVFTVPQRGTFVAHPDQWPKLP
ncbi:GntR family transcriptional regulator [Acrocarpospora sp. B8E8]